MHHEKRENCRLINTLDKMLKVSFKKSNNTPFAELLIYSSLNPIPFSLNMNQESFLPETIYSRNLAGSNFLEFRFDKNTKQLYEITLVAVQKDTVEIVESITREKLTDDFFVCFIEEEEILQFSTPISIKRNSKSLSMTWDSANLNFFPITENCMLGVNSDNCLSSVILTGLDKEILFEIFGF